MTRNVQLNSGRDPGNFLKWERAVQRVWGRKYNMYPSRVQEQSPGRGWERNPQKLKQSGVTPKFHLARLNTTRSTCRAHAFWLCRHCRTAQLDSLDTTRATRNLQKRIVASKGLSFFRQSSPTQRVAFFLFYLHVRSKHRTKLVHASSSSAMLEKHGTTHSSRSTRSKKSNVSSRVESSQVEFWA